MNTSRVSQIRGIRWASKLHVCMCRAYVHRRRKPRACQSISCDLKGDRKHKRMSTPAVDGRKILNFILPRRNRFIIDRNNRRPDIIPRKYSSSHRPVFACRSMYGNFTATSPWKLDACGMIS